MNRGETAGDKRRIAAKWPEVKKQGADCCGGAAGNKKHAAAERYGCGRRCLGCGEQERRFTLRSVFSVS